MSTVFAIVIMVMFIPDTDAPPVELWKYSGQDALENCKASGVHDHYSHVWTECICVSGCGDTGK